MRLRSLFGQLWRSRSTRRLSTRRLSALLLLLLSTAAAPAVSAADPASADAAERARSVVGQSGFQGEIPELEGIVARECRPVPGAGRSGGSGSAPDSAGAELGSGGQGAIADGIGSAAASAAPLASLVIQALAILMLLIVAGVVLLMIFQAFDRRRHRARVGGSGVVTASGEPELQLAPIEEAERLAAAGDYAAAAHLLLQHVLRQLTGRAGSRLVPSQTSREVLRGLRLESHERRDAGVLMDAVERSFFGGRELSRSDYEACREVSRSSFDLSPGSSS